jgi:hypothetical protein
MKKILIAIFLTIFIVNLKAELRPVASLTFLEGTVSIFNENDFTWVKVKLNEPIYVGDRIKTSEDTRTVVTYDDGTSLKIKEKTELIIKNSGIDVFDGQLWVHFIKTEDKNFEVKTPTLVAGVRGTKFEVRANKNNSSVAVFKGRVEVAKDKKYSNSVYVDRGYETNAKKYGQVQKAYKFNIDERMGDWEDTNWVKFSSKEEALKNYYKVLFRGINTQGLSEEEIQTIIEKRKNQKDVLKAYDVYLKTK